VLTKKQLQGWLTARADSTLVQAPRALLASGLAALLDCVTLVLLVERAGWNPVPAAVCSYLLGAPLQYLLSSLWVFPAAPANVSTGFIAFVLLSLIGLGITALTMAVLFDWLHVYYMLSKGVALGLSFSWNFLSRKYWLFKPAT
jgi:putative flippase GtrA